MAAPHQPLEARALRRVRRGRWRSPPRSLGARSLRKETVSYASYFDESVQGLEVGLAGQVPRGDHRHRLRRSTSRPTAGTSRSRASSGWTTSSTGPRLGARAKKMRLRGAAGSARAARLRRHHRREVPPARLLPDRGQPAARCCRSPSPRTTSRPPSRR